MYSAARPVNSIGGWHRLVASVIILSQEGGRVLNETKVPGARQHVPTIPDLPARHAAWWRVGAVSLSGLPVFLGLEAGPISSSLTEVQALTALGVGLLAGTGLIWAALNSPRRGTPALRVLVLWRWVALAICLMAGALTAVWASQTLRSTLALPTVGAVLAVVAGGGALGWTARKGSRAAPTILTGMVVCAWVGVVIHIRWTSALIFGRIPVDLQQALTGLDAAPISSHAAVALIVVRLIDVAAMGAAYALVLLPLVLDELWNSSRDLPSVSSHPSMAVAGLFVGVTWLLASVGTQLSLPTFEDPATALVGSAGGWTAVALTGGCVAFITLGMSRWSRQFWPPPRHSAEAVVAVAGSLVLALTALLVYSPALAPTGLGSGPVATGFVDSELGIFAAGYVVAPLVGIALAQRRWGAVKARWWPWVAAGAGLLASVPFVRGFGRWSPGGLVHALVPVLPSYDTHRILFRAPTGWPDLALAVAVAVAFVAYAVGPNSPSTARAPTHTPG